MLPEIPSLLLGPILASTLACGAAPAPAVTVDVVTAPARINHERGIAALQTVPVGRPARPGHGAHGDHLPEGMTVSGLMSGRIEIASDIGFGLRRWPEQDRVCAWIADLSITIHVQPEIFIAREYAPDTCEYQAVLEHENKHVAMDRWIAHAYQRRFRNKMTALVGEIGMRGPMTESIEAQVLDRMSAHVQATLDEVTAEMFHTRDVRQREIDSLEEYQRVTAQCDGWLSEAVMAPPAPLAR